MKILNKISEENKIKILKKNNKVTKVELNGEIIKGVTKLEIKNDYTPNSTKESVIVEISNISSLQIMEEK